MLNGAILLLFLSFLCEIRNRKFGCGGDGRIVLKVTEKVEKAIKDINI